MGGIGISLDLQETKSSRSTPLVSLPPKVVEDIASKLGIMTAKTKRALSERLACLKAWQSPSHARRIRTNSRSRSSRVVRRIK